MKFATKLFVGLILAAGPAILCSQAQSPVQDMKTAGQATGEAAKDTGKAVKHSAKKAKHKVKKSHKTKQSGS